MKSRPLTVMIRTIDVYMWKPRISTVRDHAPDAAIEPAITDTRLTWHLSSPHPHGHAKLAHDNDG